MLFCSDYFSLKSGRVAVIFYVLEILVGVDVRCYDFFVEVWFLGSRGVFMGCVCVHA
jgi:hypothetical protein